MGRPGANGPHDLGGVDLDLPLDRSDKDYALWERTTHALMLALVRKGLLTVDELRRGIEGLSEEAQKLTYYEKWAASLAAICVERGVVTEDELQAQLGTKEEQTQQPRFHAGDLVRVREENSAVRWRKPHLRTPGYIFGLVGRIERDCQGLFGNPEDLAFRHDAPKQPMYRVRFSQVDVWEGYVGGDNDSVDVEIYQPWLLPATQEELAAQHAARASRRAVFLGHAADAAAHAPAHGDAPAHHHHHAHEDNKDDHVHGESHKRQRVDAGTHGHDHAHEHGHSHAHDHADAHDHGDDHDHVHEERCAVEQAAVNKETEEDAERRRLAEALARAVVAKGVVTPAELREGVELMDTRGHSGAGARIVARAWIDPEFKTRLLKDAGAAVAELGISASVYPTPPAAATPNAATEPGSAQEAATPPAAPAAAPAPPVLPVRHGTILTVVENTQTVHNLIVCTLCSCYPLSILGMSPNWYKSRAYRARAVRDPRGVLREFGTELPEGVTVAVHDSTADNRYLVLPLRPSGTEGWSEEQLQALVTRDTMIGVAVCKVPAA